MNILMFNYEYPPLGGGGGVINQLLAEELATRHHVHVITSAYRGLERQATLNGVEITRVPVFGRNENSVASLPSMLSYPPSAWFSARKLIRHHRVDIVSAFFAVPTGPGSLPCARFARVPHVLSILGGDIYDPSKRLSPHRLPLVRNAVDMVMRRSDAVIAESEDVRNRAYEHYSYRGPIDIIPLGIRVPAYHSRSRAELQLPEGVFLAVTVGRLVSRKRIEHLLEALSQPECERLHLVIVGAGPELENLQARSMALGVNSRITFTGRVSEERKWQILAASDVYASATMHEGFGLVYLEAMAAGLPVVTYDEGGQLDFLQDGETGYLVPEGNQQSLAAALARAAEHPGELASMGRKCTTRSERYRIERCAEAYERLFLHLSERNGQSQRV